MSGEPDIEKHVRVLTRSLEIEFAGRVPPGAVAEAVQAALARYQGARIKRYVPVFVERDVRAALRHRTPSVA